MNCPFNFNSLKFVNSNHFETISYKMGKDYYGILECERGATDYDIANAYRALAPRWHPSRNEGNIAVAFTRFHNLAEAYEVLSDREKRGCYDRFGEFGLKNGIPDT